MDTYAGPGGRIFGDDLGPFFRVEVEGEWIFSDITQYIEKVEVDQTVDMASQIKITVFNPAHAFDVVGGERDFAGRELPDFTTHKVFLPGNQVDVLGGYGPYSRAVHLGRGKLWKHAPRFPRDQSPMLDIIGYDASKLMMGERSEDVTIASDSMTIRGTGTGEDSEGQVFPDMTHSENGRNLADKYGFIPDIDDTGRIDNVFQKKDMSDYALVRGLANLNDRDFWVDFDYYDTRQWVLHWRIPEYTGSPLFTFRYKSGDATSLLEFEPEYALTDGPVELKVMYFDSLTGQWQYLLESDEGVPDPDPRYRRGGSRADRNTATRRSDGTVRAGRGEEAIEEEITSATRLRLAAAGHSIDIIADRHFTSAADALEYARRWFQARRNSFIIGTGKVVGNEALRPRQIHRLEGLGSRLSGDYYIIQARHDFMPDSGYETLFKAHKVLEE